MTTKKLMGIVMDVPAARPVEIVSAHALPDDRADFDAHLRRQLALFAEEQARERAEFDAHIEAVAARFAERIMALAQGEK